MSRFVYSVVRFVPDPARGEFINVGAIAGSEESSEWAVRQVSNSTRANKIDERDTLDAVWSWLTRVSKQIGEYEAANEQLFGDATPLSEDWLHQMYVDQQNIVQLSPPAPLIAESADDALDRVFQQHIVDPGLEPRARRLTKHAAQAAVRAAFKEHEVGFDSVIEHVELRTPRMHRQKMDFAVRNGRALQLTQTWSFAVQNTAEMAQQIKAWGWTIHDVRLEGGELHADEQQVEVPDEVPIRVVYIPPAGSDELLREALNIFEELNVAAIPSDRAGEVGEEAAELLERLDSS